MLDEPEGQYFLCGSPGSPTVATYFRTDLAGVTSGEAWRAIMDPGRRLLRDPESEFRVLRPARGGDPTHEEEVAYAWRAAWPFWDREVLCRRWSLPLPARDTSWGGDSIAVVMRSLDDDRAPPPRGGRVRAFVHGCAYLLRPCHGGRHGGEAQEETSLELAVCMQVDLGGRCPEWAQEPLARRGAQLALRSARELREHCLEMRGEGPGGEGARHGGPQSEGQDERWSATLGCLTALRGRTH